MFFGRKNCRGKIEIIEQSLSVLRPWWLKKNSESDASVELTLLMILLRISKKWSSHGDENPMFIQNIYLYQEQILLAKHLDRVQHELERSFQLRMMTSVEVRPINHRGFSSITRKNKSIRFCLDQTFVYPDWLIHPLDGRLFLFKDSSK